MFKGCNKTIYFTRFKRLNKLTCRAYVNFEKSLLVMVAVTVIFSGTANAQGSAGTAANISATVIVPIAISKTSDMELGKIVSDPNGATMSIASTGVRTFSNSANRTASNPNGTAATFHVTGDNSCSFSTVHTGNGEGAGVNGLFLTDGASHSMWFTIDGTTSQSLSSGTTDYKVTGTLMISANQAAGSYSGSFTELVAYE